MAKMDIKQRIIDAIKNKDVEGLKKLREELGRDQWLNQFGGKSVPISVWIDPLYNPNPFIEFKD